jgi:hypothetical protein
MKRGERAPEVPQGRTSVPHQPRHGSEPTAVNSQADTMAHRKTYVETQLAGLRALYAIANSSTATTGRLPVEALTLLAQDSSLPATAPVMLLPETGPQSTVTPPATQQARRAGVVGLLREPALRGAMALMLSYIVSGALAFAFWGIAAHHQDAASVGSVSAEVSAITFLASMGSLNLINVFARFLPEAGGHARRMILTSYACATLAGSLLAVIFLLTPLSDGLVLGGEFGRLGFALCVVLNSIFMIQDGGLIGFGRAAWVPIENILVAVARLALMPVALAFFSAKIGLLWSWGLPMAAAVLVINALNIGLLAGRQSNQRPQLPAVGELSRYIAIESVTTAVTSAVSALLPALVTRQLGAAQGGYFYVPWTISTMASGLLSSIMISMVREVVARPEGSYNAIRRSLCLVSLVVVGGLLTCLFASQLVLSPLGSAFAAHGAPLLRWIGLALPATAINVLFWAVCLVRRRPFPVLALNLAISTGIIGGSLLLQHGASITDIGIIYCAVQWTVAVVVSIPTVKALRVVREGKLGDESWGAGTTSSSDHD